MKHIKISDTKVSRDCVLIWGILRDNTGITLSELYEHLGDSRWKETRRWKVTMCSNLAYVLKRLRELKCIEIIQNRNTGGEFDYATINLIAEPVIRKEVVLCRECGCEFKKKGTYSKHKDICLECTKKLYMTPVFATCSACGVSSAAKNMKSIEGNLYDLECHQKYIKKLRDEKRALLAEAQRKKRYCIECKLVEIKKRAKFCRDCFAQRAAKRKGIKFCVVCGDRSNSSGYTCGNPACTAINYVKSDAFFNNRKRDSNSKDSLIKKKILGESCVVCSYNTFIQYHHVIFRENGGKDVMSNIVPLCPNHHMEVHHCGLDISEYHKQVLNRLDLIARGAIKIDV